MNIAVFSTKSYDRTFLEKANEQYGHSLTFLKPTLDQHTAQLAFGYEAICVFVNDHLHAEVLESLAEQGLKCIALRCAGFNNVDLKAADRLGIQILRVPAYSPHGVAEHAIALMMALNRKLYRAHNRVREGNFSLEGLLGFDMYGKTVGVIGTGKIGRILAKIMLGFDMKVLAYDPYPHPECEAMGIEYVSLDELFAQSDVISLHVPLLKDTYHLIDDNAIAKMKDGVMIINTSRGKLIDTQAVINGLKSGRIGYLGLDVYEEEEELFFEDLSSQVIQDDVFARLLTFPNVMVTGHQAFFTQTALTNIAEVTLSNVADFERDAVNPDNVVHLDKIKN